MSQEMLRQLLNQYISDELSAVEKAKLMEMINQPAYHEALEEFIREIMLSDDYAEIDSPVIKAKIDDYLSKHMQPKKDSALTGRISPIWLRIAAAAVFIVIATGALFLAFYKPQSNTIIKTTSQVPPPKQDVQAPQIGKAILTLANGRQIILNDAASGSLTTEGSAKVIKLADGGIVYDAERKAAEVTYNVLNVPRGSNTVSLTLSDGTRVWLNAASSLKYPVVFTGSQRTVEITGEAYFEVSRNKTMPFIVKKLNDDTRVQVLGTHFNVNAYDDENDVRVTLLEGAVNVTKGNSAMLIRPGQQAIVTQAGMQLNDHPDLEKTVSWKNNEFIFENDDIESIMRQLTRWYDIEVAIERSSDRKYIGRINRNVPLSEVLRMFENVGYIHFTINGKKVTVTPTEK